MKKILIVLGLLAFVTACSEKTNEKLGLVKQVPNEKMIQTNQPLTLPPDFDVTPVSEASRMS